MPADMQKRRLILAFVSLIMTLILVSLLVKPWDMQARAIRQLAPRDISEVDRIVLFDSHHSTELLRVDKSWQLYGSEPVNTMAIENLLMAAGRLEVLSIVDSKVLAEPGEPGKETRSIRFFKGDKLLLSYGLKAVSGRFMLIPPDSESVYYVSVPGYPGLDLNRVFSAVPDHYREHLFIDLLPSEISGIEIDLASGEAFRFIQDLQGNISCEPGNEHTALPSGDPDELAIQLLFSYFTSVRYEQRAGIPANSLRGDTGINRKLAGIVVNSFSGESHSMEVFSYHENEAPEPHLFRALVLYNEEEDAIFVNYIYLDVLMRSLSHYFGEK